AMLYLFFFQEDDGIRDFHVTGVQTCALPISLPFAEAIASLDSSLIATSIFTMTSFTGLTMKLSLLSAEPLILTLRPSNDRLPLRSEERRVGKGCRCCSRREHLIDTLSTDIFT